MSSSARLLALPSALLFLGAGCAYQTPLASPRIAETFTPSSENGPIAQRGGFGEIPTVPPPVLRAGSHGSVRVTAAFPDLPPFVTVLRERSGRPNATELQNIANSLTIPGSVIGARPVGFETSLEWQDEAGLRWNAKGSERRLTFTRPALRAQTLTVSSPVENAKAIETARRFLTDHGVDPSKYGSVYIQPNWAEWWKSQLALNRCMTMQNVLAVRVSAVAQALSDAVFPLLPAKNGSPCVNPEFPAQVIIRFNATQDGQAIFANDGTPIYGATMVYDATTATISSGWFTLGVNPDRSDYPGITKDQARERFARGGQGGAISGDATVSKITFEWIRIDDGRQPSTTYLYPTIIGEGMVQSPDGTTSPIRIVVPLVRP